GQVCRLRDIHDLLMDTGLGAKAYAIIEQGKIGMILSTRPTDRRQLIDEAAGITKYKSRRRSAELKLEAAQQNLTRIDDIVLEIARLQQQTAFDREQVQTIGARADIVAAELAALEARREPALAGLAARRLAAAAADAERDRAAETLTSESGAYEAAHRGIEGL